MKCLLVSVFACLFMVSSVGATQPVRGGGHRPVCPTKPKGGNTPKPHPNPHPKPCDKPGNSNPKPHPKPCDKPPVNNNPKPCDKPGKPGNNTNNNNQNTNNNNNNNQNTNNNTNRNNNKNVNSLNNTNNISNSANASANSSSKSNAKSDSSAVANGGSANVNVEVKVEGNDGKNGKHDGKHDGGTTTTNIVDASGWSFNGGGGGVLVEPPPPVVVVVPEPKDLVPSPELYVTFNSYDPDKKTLIDKKERVWVFFESNVTKVPYVPLGTPVRVNITVDEASGAKFLDYKGWTWVCKPRTFKK